ncbi:MAG: SHOCT domain-containing protein [Candidatus Promineifilaceae bacterium]|nr:SHOCT domain-containing protein [Candidatus Promineifilaceae bacterium]
MMGFGMGYSGFWMIIFWIAIIATGILAAAALFPRVSSSSASKKDDDAMVILRRRFARGEISKEEYQTMRHELEN